MSIRQSKTAYKYKTGGTAVAVNVHQTTASDFATSKLDYDNVPELEKLVRVLYTCDAPGLRWSWFSSRVYLSPLYVMDQPNQLFRS